jgi:hypothetical protein
VYSRSVGCLPNTKGGYLSCPIVAYPQPVERFVVDLVQLHFRAKSRPKTQQCGCPFATTVQRRMYPIPQSRGAGRRQAGTCNCGCSRSILRCVLSENKTTERPGHMAHSGGSRGRTAPRKERYLREQPHVQKLLGPIKIPRCKERHIRAPLGIRRWTDNSLSEQNEWFADRTTWWIVRKSLVCQQYHKYGRAKVLLVPGKKYWEVVPPVVDPRSRKSGPDAPVNPRLPLPKDCSLCSRSFLRSDHVNLYLLIATDYFSK